MARILYPAKTEPVLVAAAAPEPVTESRWHQPLTEPTRRRALTTAALVAAGLTWCPFTPTPPAETITADKWQRPLSEPTRIKGATAAQQAPVTVLVQASPFTEAVSLDRWLQRLAEPVLRRPVVQPVATSWPPYVAPAAETITVDKWYAPLSQGPRARLGLGAVLQRFLAFAQPEDVSVSRWLVPLAEPGRRARPVADQQEQALVKAAPFAETVSLDRWALPLSEPQRQRLGLRAGQQQARAFWPYPLPNVDAPVGFYGVYPDRAPGRAMAVAQQRALAFVKAAPFAESITADRWAQPPSQPTRRIASVAGHQAVAAPASVVVASPDRWWQAFSAPPVARRTQPAALPFVAVVATAGETVTLDKWHAASALPVRGKYTSTWGVVAAPALSPVASISDWAQPASTPPLRVYWPRLDLASRTIYVTPPVYRALDQKLATINERASRATLAPATPTTTTDTALPRTAVAKLAPATPSVVADAGPRSTRLA